MSDTDIIPEPTPLEPTPPDTVSAQAPSGSATSFTAASPAAAPRRRRGVLWPLLGLIGFLLLAGGEAYLWKLQKARPDLSGAVATLQAQVAALQQQQHQQPVPAAPVAVSAPAPVPPPPAAAAAGLDEKLASLAAQVGAMQTQFAADQGVLTTLQANAIDLGKLNADIGAVQTEATMDHTALTALQTNLADLNKLTGKVAAFGRIDAARMALDAGQPLGTIPNAPPALARFIEAAPPTEPALRLGFPAAARAASAASVDANGRHGTWATVRARLENLITIRDGTRVIVGAPAAGALAEAGARLDAGDLAGAVAVLNTLNQSSQQAMAGWLSQARDLLAARAALGALAAQP